MSAHPQFDLSCSRTRYNLLFFKRLRHPSLQVPSILPPSSSSATGLAYNLPQVAFDPLKVRPIVSSIQRTLLRYLPYAYVLIPFTLPLSSSDHDIFTSKSVIVPQTTYPLNFP